MRNESQFYQDKENKQIAKFRELCRNLPKYASAYLQNRELVVKYSTLTAYAYDLQVFFQFFAEQNPVLKNSSIKEIPADFLVELTEEDIMDFQRYLRFHESVDKKVSKNDNKAIARKMAPIRGLFDYMVRKKYISANIAKNVEMPKVKSPKIIKKLSNDGENNEVERLLSGMETILTNPSIPKRQKAFLKKDYFRDNAIIWLLLGTGIRISECEGLDIKDVDFENKSINIKRKGGFYDIVYFNDEVSLKLKNYIDNERKQYLSDNTPEKDKEALFLSRKYRRLSVDAMENLVEKYTLILLGKKFSPHKCRATYGTTLYQKTNDIRLVADVLGHSNINTTAKHYAAQTEENKKRAGNIDFK